MCCGSHCRQAYKNLRKLQVALESVNFLLVTKGIKLN